MLAFGSFGVPIKSRVATALDIDPLVMQTYKTIVCFLTSWIVLGFGEELHFTPWGIVSGLFWVPGGVATIYAVKAAGLAIGIGIGSSFIVLVSFVWGIFVFDEQIHSRTGACGAILCIMVGLLGMSYYSSPVAQAAHAALDLEDNGSLSLSGSMNYEPVTMASSYDENDDHSINHNNHEADDAMLAVMAGNKISLTDRTAQTNYSDSMPSEADDELVVDRCDDDDDDDGIMHEEGSARHAAHSEAGSTMQSSHVVMCGGVVMTKRRLGMLSAMFCGIWGGSILAPMKWCKSDVKGVGYLISFAIGASLVTLWLWIMRYGYYIHKYGSPRAAYEQLPSFHFRAMWKVGGLCGLLWSIGNFFSLYSVLYLGEGVGYPLVQTSIFVSGLWGIFYFKVGSCCVALKH
jgi:hypothetical protein